MFACACTTWRALFCVYLYSYNLASSLLCLLVTLQLTTLRLCLFMTLQLSTFCLCLHVQQRLSALNFVFSCTASAQRALCWVCLYRYNLTSSVLCLFVMLHLCALWFELIWDATPKRAPFRRFVCKDLTWRTLLYVCKYSYSLPYSVLCCLYSNSLTFFILCLPVQIELGALSSVLLLTLQRSALCSVFVCDATT